MNPTGNLWPSSWLASLRLWIRAVIKRRTVEWEIEEELRYHLARETERLVEDGATVEQARAEAEKAFGNKSRTKEECRGIYLVDTRRRLSILDWRIDMWLQDLKFAVRTITKNPLFSFVVVVTLGIGIGANTMVFSVVNPLLLRPLPYEAPERLVQIAHIDPRSGFDQSRISLSQYLDWREHSESFVELGVYTYSGGVVTADGIEPQSLNVGHLSSNMLSLLGVQPVMGRSMAPEDDRPGAEGVVLLSHGFWQVSFGGKLDVLGQTITLDGRPHTIIGIMERGFNFPYPEVRMWKPLAIDRSAEPRGQLNYLAVGRLNAETSVDLALNEMQAIHARFGETYPDIDGRFGINVVPLRQGLLFFYGGVKIMMSLLMVAVGFVLLIVAANIAGVMLARAGGRINEFAIRSVLGSSRLRLIRQVLTESTLLALLGGLAGCTLAYVVVGLVGNAVPAAFYRVGDIQVDSAALVFTLLMSLLAALLFGSTPALRSSKVDLSQSMKEGGRVGTGRRSGVIRNVLVVAQVGKAVILLAGAAAMMKAFLQIQNVDLGFIPEKVATTGITLPAHKYQNPAERQAFFANALDQMRGISGVSSAAGITPLPLDFSTNMVSFYVDGHESLSTHEPEYANEMIVTPGFFSTFGVQMLRGRDFNAMDDRSTPDVVVVNELAATRYWPAESPIGQTIRIVDNDGDGRTATVVGVVRDIRQRNVWADESSIWPQFYFPFSQRAGRHLSLVSRTAGDPSLMAGAIRQEIRSLDSDLPLGSVRTMEQVIEQALGPMRLISVVLGCFGFAAILLAAVGIYGIVACAVNQRTHEIGIRVALGAHPKTVVAMVLKHGMLLTTIGIVIGTLLAMVLVAALASQGSGASGGDYAIVMGIAFFLGMVALFASYLPARRAAHVDPMVILKVE